MKVALVAGVVVANDAISGSLALQAEILQQMPTVESVAVFAQHVGRDLSSPCYEATDPWTLARHREFASCDIAIFHWGIYYDLFNVVTLLGASGPRPVVHFHNCTPRQLVAEAERDVIDRSMVQLENALSLGLPMWTFSEFNRRTLLHLGAEQTNIAFVPIPIETPAYSRVVRRCEVVQLLAVGRRVPAKGLHVLIEALSLLDEEDRQGVRLRVAGSSTFSALGYTALLAELVETHRLGSIVTFVDEPTDAELWDLYRTSDVVVSASFHEGLCVPIIEGYSVGCRAIGTTAGNLPFVVQAPDPCVEPGDPYALARAIKRIAAEVRATTERQRLHPEFIEQFSIDACRTSMQRELDRLSAGSTADSS